MKKKVNHERTNARQSQKPQKQAEKERERGTRLGQIEAEKKERYEGAPGK